jgi:DMSO/TMAO reductase YedYZ molybdopterin-dependent catalytic subunit
MVFSILHYVPSTIAAVLTVALTFNVTRRFHKHIGTAVVLSSLLGLAGYLSSGNLRLFPIDFHTLHVMIGLAALTLSTGLFFNKIFFVQARSGRHCLLGKLAAASAGISLVMGLALLSGLVAQESKMASPLPEVQEPVSSHLPEAEAASYQGVRLTPLSEQGNNAIRGTQGINRATYRLQVTGLVERNLNKNYEQLLELPAYSELVYMPCVEEWGFPAKWTGFRVLDLLNLSGLKPSAKFVLFSTADGYSTSLPLDYLSENRILLAYGINDVTLPPERGFPLQLVAKNKYGFKWAKWITGIEVMDRDVKGYWESRGYSNSANVGQFPFEP